MIQLHYSPRQTNRRMMARLFAVVTASSIVLASLTATAGPGAHGPDGQHLDGPAAGTASGTLPRVEAKTDLFELVAQLGGGELSILIDHFASNAPLLQAKVGVESGTLKAVAKFHADHGDYSVDDPAFLKAISAPGTHPLVFTIITDEESDLIDATLTISSAINDHAHDAKLFGIPTLWLWIAGGIVLAGTALLLVGRRLRRGTVNGFARSRA
jgi:hypothetical protein